eukprot:502600-Rhodomonas_salina.1
MEREMERWRGGRREEGREGGGEGERGVSTEQDSANARAERANARAERANGRTRGRVSSCEKGERESTLRIQKQTTPFLVQSASAREANGVDFAARAYPAQETGKRRIEQSSAI